MSVVVHHSLTIVNRNIVDGVAHRHPFQPTCTCGWFGVPRRRRQGTEQEYRSHLASKARTGIGVAARDVTPADQLPETLR